MTTIWAIALVVIVEMIRRKDFYVLFVLTALITLVMGSVNIFNDDTRPYPRVSKETLVLRKPEVILELRPEEVVDAARRKMLDSDWAPLSSLPAVRDGRIVYITEAFVQIPGPRMVETARLFQKAIQGALVKRRDGK